MKKVFLFLVFSCFGTMLAAQDLEENNHRVGLSYGLAGAVGNFGDTDFRNNQSGFARTGSLRFSSYAINVNRHFGIGASAGTRVNPVDTEKMLSAYNQRQPDGSVSTAVENKMPWANAFLLTDLFLQHSIDKLDFFAKGSVGFSYNFYSETWYGYYYPAGSTDMVYRDFRASKDEVAPAFGMAGGLRYNIGDFGIGVEVGLLSISPTFNLNNGTSDMRRSKQQMKTVNPSVSLSYGFSGKPYKAAATQESEAEGINHRVAVNVGAAIPIGVFRRNNVFSPQAAAFALSGTYASLSYVADIHPSLGIGTTLGWRRNGFDMEVFAPYVRVRASTPSALVSYKSGTWDSQFMTSDLYFRLPFGSFNFFTKSSFGAAYTRSPALTVTLISDADSKITELKWKPSATFKPVYGYSGGFSYEAGRIGMSIEAGVMLLKSKSKLLLQTPAGGETHTINSFNTNVGLYYRI